MASDPTEPLPDARAAWNRGAAAYDRFIESGADWFRLHVHGPGLLAACGRVEGLQALDLGCGQGYFSRALAMRGAHVVGIDISDALIARARQIEAGQPCGIDYRRLDAADAAAALEPARFDLVAACMSLQDIDDIPATLSAARRLLRGNGRLVFSVPHPCTDMPVREWLRDAQGCKLALKLDRYFDTGPAICDWNMPRLGDRWQTGFRRHTLSEWVALLRTAGFALLDLLEPRATAAQVEANPQLEPCSRMPYFLVVVAGPVTGS
jgi:2-polyprenyl-3-methyl-5-hydroxy-6-metoxy-1,4-benzoquinol methylase